jgi:hypothetical protein
MTGSKLCTDGGTYGDQDIKRTGLDQEKHYSARQCRSLALVIKVQQGLAILPLTGARRQSADPICYGRTSSWWL